jgi:hypothetical protein
MNNKSKSLARTKHENGLPEVRSRHVTLKLKKLNPSRRNKFEEGDNYKKEILNLLLIYPWSKETLWTRVGSKVGIKAQTRLNYISSILL